MELINLKSKLIKWRAEINKESQKLAKLVNFNYDEYQKKRNIIFLSENVLGARKEYDDEKIKFILTKNYGIRNN